MNNFLKITLRNLIRNKVYASISILGLALGISSCLLIALYVVNELSYDKFHEKQDRIYRVASNMQFNGEINAALTSLAFGPTITDEYPEVESYVRFSGTGQYVELTVNDQVFQEQNVWFTDSTVFDVFTYRLLQGEPSKALAAPNSIVLTKTLKEKLFGDEDAMGNELKLNNTMLTVTGVMEDPPATTDMPINGLISLSTMPQQQRAALNQDWFRISFFTYLLFDQPQIPNDFQQKLDAFSEKYVQPWAAQNQLEASIDYSITPLPEVHFQQGFDYDLPKGNMNYILVFSLLALFILIIASINYINISLAQSSKRAKEVGIRKTLGALRGELIKKFIGESVIITLIAVIIGLALVELLMPTFNNTTGKSLGIMDVFQLPIILTLSGIIILVGILAGSYPALVLSSFQPVKVLKGVIPKEGGVGALQKTLIFLQFVFSLFMITATMLINDQMDYMKSMNLGFDKENVVTIMLPADTNVNKQVAPWVEELRQDSRIMAVSQTNMPTGNTGELMFRIDQDGKLTERGIRFLFVDQDFIEVLGLDLKQGRNFDREIATDQQQAFIINENAAKAFGWEEPLGKRMQWGLMPNGQASNDGKVIGVVNDFHYLSLHNPMEPLVLIFNPSGSNVLSMRLSSGDYTTTLSSLEDRWKEITAKHPFKFQFLDEQLEQNYQQEQAMSTIFDYFAAIAILIAAFGLFALLSFSIQNRQKEIGVRKVLGASVGQISWILVKDLFYLLLLAFVIITPICVILMNRWLEDFAYDVPIRPVSFALALSSACLLIGLTISYHIFRIHRSNPVDALRYE